MLNEDRGDAPGERTQKEVEALLRRGRGELDEV